MGLITKIVKLKEGSSPNSTPRTGPKLENCGLDPALLNKSKKSVKFLSFAPPSNGSWCQSNQSFDFEVVSFSLTVKEAY